MGRSKWSARMMRADRARSFASKYEVSFGAHMSSAHMCGSDVAGTTDQRVYYMFAARSVGQQCHTPFTHSSQCSRGRVLDRCSAACGLRARWWWDVWYRSGRPDRARGGWLSLSTLRAVCHLPRSVWQGQGLECLPEILSKCIAALRKSGMLGNTCASADLAGLGEVGLFRLPGRSSRIRDLKTAFNTGLQAKICSCLPILSRLCLPPLCCLAAQCTPLAPPC